jgi:hypothetical protein
MFYAEYFVLIHILQEGWFEYKFDPSEFASYKRISIAQEERLQLLLLLFHIL